MVGSNYYQLMDDSGHFETSSHACVIITFCCPFFFTTERVYFVDGERGDLKEVHKDNDGTQVSNDLGIDNLYSPYYVALDWVAK